MTKKTNLDKILKKQYIKKILSNKKISLVEALNSDYKFLFVPIENAEKFLQHDKRYKCPFSVSSPSFDDVYDSRVLNAPIVICSLEGKEETEALVLFKIEAESDRENLTKSMSPTAYI